MNKTKNKATVKTKRTNSKLSRRKSIPSADKWALRLYIAGWTPKSVIAFENLKHICQEQLSGKYRIEVVDLLVDPRLARDNQILAVPTLVRKLPLPIRSIIGDLSDAERVLVGLDLINGAAPKRAAKG